MKTKPKNQHGGPREGAGRKPKYGEKTERFTVRFPVSLLDRVLQQDNPSQTVIEAVRAYFKRSQS